MHAQIQQLLKSSTVHRLSAQRIQSLAMAPSVLHRQQEDNMTLRIERSSEGGDVVLRLLGRIQSEHLEDLKLQIGGAEPPVALDLEGVSLVDLEVIRFLASCEAAGIEVLHCSPYIREWMRREQDGP